MIIQIFAMFERKIQKHLPYRRQLAVKARCYSVAGQFARFSVSCERSGCAAEHVARELIEQQNQRETTSWLVPPVLKTSVRGIFVAGKEPRRTKPVEFRSRKKPARLNHASIGSRFGR